MARKPKAIEVPGDTAPAQFESLAKPAEKAAPQPKAANTATPTGEILERASGWIRTQYGWIKE